MATTRAYNTTRLRLMVDSAGHGIDPATWRKINPADPTTARLLATGRLLREPVKAAPKPPSEPAGGKPGGGTKENQ